MSDGNKKFTTLLIITFLLAAGAVFFFWVKPKYFSAVAAKPAAPLVTEVTVIDIKKEKVQLFQELPARVTAFRIAEIRPQIQGILKKKIYTEGSFVKEGKQLYQIDPTIYQIAYDNAKQNLKTTQAKKNRYQGLLEMEAISKQEYDDILAALALAKANFDTAKTNLIYTKVLSPISGYIGKSNIQEGMLLTANQAEVLTTITQLDPIYVDMVQPSKEVIKMGNQKNVPVSLKIDEIEYNNTGKLEFSEVFVDESTDSVRLRARFSNKDKKLMPGMFVSAKLHLKPFEAITIPQRVTTRNPDGSLAVWIVDQNNVAKLRLIKAEQAFDDKWIVLEGLEEGETVIYEGFQKVVDGAQVKPVQLQVEEKN